MVQLCRAGKGITRRHINPEQAPGDATATPSPEPTATPASSRWRTPRAGVGGSQRTARDAGGSPLHARTLEKRDGREDDRGASQGKEMRRDLGWRSQVGAEVAADRLGLDVCTWPVQVLRETRVDDVIGVARRLDAPRRGRLMAQAMGRNLVHPGNHPWVQDPTLPGHRVQREAGEFAPTGPSTAIHTRDGGRAGRRRTGVRPVLVRTGGVRRTSTSTSPWRKESGNEEALPNAREFVNA